MPIHDFQSDRFIRAVDVRQRYSISNPTLHRWVKSGKIPPPEFINGQRVWRQSVIEKAERQLLSAEHAELSGSDS